MKNFFSSVKGLVLAGALIGLVAVFLQKMGNPGNMGICVACFQRDLAGSLGFHSAKVLQYARPEIMALVLGAFGAAILNREFRPRLGSAPVLRFFLGAIIAIGSLVFLGCPWRALLRLAGGDLNAIFGLLGLIGGIFIGTIFLKQNYSLGRNYPAKKAIGFVFPIFIVFLLIIRLVYPPIMGAEKNGILNYSLTGPASQYAPFLISFMGALIIGFLGQRSRFCTMGAFRDLILFRQFHLLKGVISFLIFAFLGNIILKQFNLGFDGQPVAHTLWLWNFLGLFVVGLASCLAGACPGRQLFLAAEGDADAAILVLGLMAGAAAAHNWALASSASGLGANGMAAVFICLAILLFIGLSFRNKVEG